MIQLDAESSILFAMINEMRDAYLDLESVVSIDSTVSFAIRMEADRQKYPPNRFFCVFDSPVTEFSIVLHNVADKKFDFGVEKLLMLSEVKLESQSIEFSGSNGKLRFYFRANEGKVDCTKRRSEEFIRHIATPFFDVTIPRFGARGHPCMEEAQKDRHCN